MHALRARVPAASFKTPREVLDYVSAGCEAITLSVDMSEQTIFTPAITAKVKKSDHNWIWAFGVRGL